ncbi:YhdP family protein [Lysobacter humi (ex Lee et al. 2017)]
MILRHAKRAHVGLGYLLAAAVIGFAIVLGLASLALPLLAQHPARVEAWLEHRTGRPVAFDALRTDWTRLGPLVRLQGLRIGEGGDAVLLGDAELLASVYQGLLPGHAFTQLRLRGLDLTLERGRDGLWHVRGLPGQETAGGDPFAALDRLGELHVVDGRLAVVAPELGIDLTVPRVDVRMRVDGDRVRAGVRAWPAANATPVDGVVEYRRASGDANVYAGAQRVDLARWSGALKAAGVRVTGGRGRAEAWADVRDKRVTRVTARASLGEVTLAGAPLDGRAPAFDVGTLDVLGEWTAAAGRWSVALPRLRIGAGQREQTLDGLAIAGGGRFGLAAREVDAAPLLQAAALTDRMEPGLRRWIRAARPAGLVQELRMHGRGEALRVEARVRRIGFARVGGSPGISGLAGGVLADTRGLEFDFDPTSPVRFAWPQAFGPDHVVRLSGRANGWQDAPGWRVDTQALHVAGEGYAADVRGGLQWQGDGSRPWMTLAADIRPAQVPVAKRFWVRHVMPATVVHWLDAALVGGRVEQGRAIVAGDLDHWPFVHGEGRFEARGHVVGATVKFQPDWPAAEDVTADVAFVGNGFEIDGRGRVGQIALPRLQASIDDYSHGTLRVDAQGLADAARVLEVVRASPLRAMQPETFDAISASGPAAVEFGLSMPLGRAEPLAIDGSVDLRGATLADRRWNLRFDDVRGRARYDQAGFAADRLLVRHDGQPGALALRAGVGHVRDARNAFEGGVDGSFDIDALLARAPEMAWLAPHVGGRSTWTVGVVVPRAAPGVSESAHLQLRSSLVGTALDLPAPLRKPSGEALAAFVDTPLPLGSGDVTVALGDVMGVRARTVRGRTGVRVALGGGTVSEPAPAEGLVATGRAAQLDALDWIAFARGGTGSGGDGLSLQRVDVSTARLMMLGGQFGESRLQVAPAAGGALGVRVDGPALAGSITVPDRGGTISGRFARVHWRPPPAPAAGSRTTPAVANASRGGPAPSARTAAAAAPASVDPAGLPGISVDIDDLRLGTASLGASRLRMRPMPGGLALEQFVAQGRGQKIEATGSWTGRASAARTRLDVAVTSSDFGALLAGFGFGGRLGGGKGTARFVAGWEGAPTDFSAAALEGSLAVDARDGRLLEVEPGAGRVLGLLSLAELPRRLTLDFRDFFSKGFSFNRLRGTVRLGGGLARSEGLAIRGPAADIDIEGAANLRQQTFDQTIEVRPKSGNLLTAVGALTGGPVGAAIGAAANAVLRKPLGQIGAKTYRVTGPWADPKVEVMSRSQSRTHVPVEPAG